MSLCQEGAVTCNCIITSLRHTWREADVKWKEKREQLNISEATGIRWRHCCSQCKLARGKEFSHHANLVFSFCLSVFVYMDMLLSYKYVFLTVFYLMYIEAAFRIIISCHLYWFSEVVSSIIMSCDPYYTLDLFCVYSLYLYYCCRFIN